MGAESIQNKDLLPGLPEDLAFECLARAPLASLWGVCRPWQELLYTSHFFHRLRSGLGVAVFEWLYTLLDLHDGSFRWFAYDPLASTWHSLPAMPDDIEFQLTAPGNNVVGRFHPVQCVSTAGKLVVVAGSRVASECGERDVCGAGKTPQLLPALERPLVFEAAERRWSFGSPFHVPRKWCVCGVVDDKTIYVAGGCGALWNVGVSKSAEMYDVEADTWRAAEALRSSKFSGEAISAVRVGTKLHVVSGKGVMMKDGAVYDVSNGSWSKMSPGLRNGWTGPCVAMNGQFYALEESSGRLKIYDPERDTWATVVESRCLRGVSQLAASRGKICGIVADGDGKIVVVDIGWRYGVRIFEVEAPMGRPVAIEVLTRMAPEKTVAKLKNSQWGSID